MKRLNRSKNDTMDDNIIAHYINYMNGNYVNELKCLSCRHEDVASSMSPCKECVSFNQYEQKNV